MHYKQRKDRFYQKAKKQGYPSRAAYKLIEMDKKWKVIDKNAKIIDLGCAPGGWFKVILDKLSPKGMAVGIDLLELKVNLPKNAHFILGDFLEESNQEKLINHLKGKANWVLSDMSHNLTGIPFKDMCMSLELAQSALEFSLNCLETNGGLIMKVFPGPDIGAFKKDLKSHFKKIQDFIPDATRKTSNEIYLVAVGFKGQ